MPSKILESDSGNHITSEEASCDLIRLVSMGSISGVKALLGAGKCDVNYVNDEGDAALMIAARRNDLEIMKFLLNYGADVEVGMGHEYLMKFAEKYHNKDMADLITSYLSTSGNINRGIL